MDEIEAGFKKIMQKIEDMKKTDATLSEQVKAHDGELLGRMAAMAKPVVKSVGLNLLKIGKQDTKNEPLRCELLYGEDDRPREK